MSLHSNPTYLNRPRDFSAAAFPISAPFFLRPMESGARSFPHRLHCVRRAKFKFLQLKINAKSWTTTPISWVQRIFDIFVRSCYPYSALLQIQSPSTILRVPLPPILVPTSPSELDIFAFNFAPLSFHPMNQLKNKISQMHTECSTHTHTRK